MNFWLQAEVKGECLGSGEAEEAQARTGHECLPWTTYKKQIDYLGSGGIGILVLLLGTTQPWLQSNSNLVSTGPACLLYSGAHISRSAQQKQLKATKSGDSGVLSCLQEMQQIILGQGGKLMTKTADPVKTEDRRQKKMRLSCMVPSQVTNPADFTDTTVSSVSFGG